MSVLIARPHSRGASDARPRAMVAAQPRQRDAAAACERVGLARRHRARCGWCDDVVHRDSAPEARRPASRPAGRLRRQAHACPPRRRAPRHHPAVVRSLARPPAPRAPYPKRAWPCECNLPHPHPHPQRSHDLPQCPSRPRPHHDRAARRVPAAAPRISPPCTAPRQVNPSAPMQRARVPRLRAPPSPYRRACAARLAPSRPRARLVASSCRCAPRATSMRDALLGLHILPAPRCLGRGRVGSFARGPCERAPSPRAHARRIAQHCVRGAECAIVLFATALAPRGEAVTMRRRRRRTTRGARLVVCVCVCC